MKKIAIAMLAALATSCASGPTEPGPRQSQLKDCPPGMTLICESQQKTVQAPRDEVPVYDRCYCESTGIN